MKVVITGGAGYIGSILAARLLDTGHSVKLLDSLMFGGESLIGIYGHPNCQFVRGDVRDRAVVGPVLDDAEAVVHLAAIVGEPACNRYPDLTRTTNLESTVMLLEEARRRGVSRFVLSSTCSNYGVSDVEHLADENAPLNPVSLYAETKVKAEEAVMRAAAPGFSSTVLRLATVYGLSTRMRFDLLVNELVRDAVARKWVVLYGPNAWRPFIHVQDAARAFETALHARPEVVSGQTFNVGSQSGNYQKRQLAELITRYIPFADVEVMERKADPRDYRVSFEKVGRLLGFVTRKTVEDGVIEIRDSITYGIVTEPFDPKYDNVSRQISSTQPS